MKTFLWLLTALMASIPLVMYLVYSMRRLDTRRQLLLQTLLNLGLDDAYMRIRHGQQYGEWCKLPAPERVGKMESLYFNTDFKAETSHKDFLWPVGLVTALSGIGWYFALSHLYPDAGTIGFKTLVPAIFVWGFVGAFFASLLSMIDEFRKYSLTPGSYYSILYRLLFSSTAALLAGKLISTQDTFSPLAAFGIGLFPVEKTWDFITDKTAQVVGSAKPEGELGGDLAAVQGLEDSRNRRKLVDVGITSVQALATADPLFVFFQTTFPIRTVVDMIDKAILYLYIGDKVKELRTHGINGIIELVALAKLLERNPAYAGGHGLAGSVGFSKFFEQVDGPLLVMDVAKVLGQSENELKAFIYNMYYDPVVMFIYDVWGRFLNLKRFEDQQPRELAVGQA